MGLSKRDLKWCRQYASANNLNPVEVVKAVLSYFDDITYAVRRLPFNNIRRIYTAGALNKMAPVYNIPYIGRIGPIYSQYVKWRAECAADYEMVLRKDVRAIHLTERIETAAALALSGKKVSANLFRDPVPYEQYYKVWIIDEHGHRRRAKQLFKK